VCTKFYPLLRQARGALIIASSTAAYHCSYIIGHTSRSMAD
jgi:hypothetical protein